METKVTRIDSIERIDDFAAQFVAEMGDETVYLFKGQMGAGKTTLINALCRALGVESDFTGSPTFAIVNEYRSDTTAELIYHFDLYRLENLGEALDMGIEDYLDSGALCLIEWPEIADEIMPDDAVTVEIALDSDDDGARVVTVTRP